MTRDSQELNFVLSLGTVFTADYRSNDSWLCMYTWIVSVLVMTADCTCKCEYIVKMLLNWTWKCSVLKQKLYCSQCCKLTFKLGWLNRAFLLAMARLAHIVVVSWSAGASFPCLMLWLVSVLGSAVLTILQAGKRVAPECELLFCVSCTLSCCYSKATWCCFPWTLLVRKVSTSEGWGSHPTSDGWRPWLMSVWWHGGYSFSASLLSDR